MIIKRKFIIAIAFFFSIALGLSAQNNSTISGFVTDLDGNPVEYANVIVSETSFGGITNSKGFYSIKVPSGKPLTVVFSYLNKSIKISFQALSPDQNYRKDVVMNILIELKTYEYKKDASKSKVPMQKVDTRSLDMLPSTTERIISLVKTLPGVSTNTELSSSYSVRGGNYDENLVYINDIEIYRPFLIRSGQQEGLPIINSDLIESISFSAGGFEAKYGDKMASVLDITYKSPKENHSDFSLNLMGASGHIEGTSKNHLFTYLAGARFRSNSYLLNTLDVAGDYTSAFSDFQSYFTYLISPEVKIGFFSYYGNNKYQLIPETRETTYGTSELALRLKVYFDGQEITSYKSFLNAFDIKIQPHDSVEYKIIASVYNTNESENFDIMGQYWLDQLDTDPGSETFGDSIFNFGVGTFLNHARNKLFADIYSLQFKNTRTYKRSELTLGLQGQHERITDQIREWGMLDSAGFSIPVTEPNLELSNFLKTTINLNSFRYNGFIQNSFTISDSGSTYLTAGIRVNYWDYNKEFIVTPRIQFVTEPNRKENLKIISKQGKDSLLKRNYQIKAALGMYYQPPFYRELRDKTGVLNPEIRSQKSYQALVGCDYYFRMWNKTFKWTTEAYFKYLDDLIPYDIEDIRIRYYAKNNAWGYATGIDMQVYGEFVGNIPSWATISVMKTMEDVEGDYSRHYDTALQKFVTEPRGLIPRPTDQRFNASILFQDFLPKVPSSKVYLNLLYGMPLPFGPPQYPYLRNLYRMRAYRRVDIGFSKLIVSKSEKYTSKFKYLNRFESVWITGEVFNLFGIENVISYFWIKDVNNSLWGVPNYLTNRRFNVNLTIKL